MRIVKVLFVIIALCSVPLGVCRAQTTLTRDSVAADTIRLSEEQRYADSVDEAEQLKLLNPSDRLSLDTHGAVALLVGAVSVADVDYHDELVRNPTDPLALYGKAICCMLEHNDRDAERLLTQIDTTTLPTTVQIQISIAKSSCLLEMGQPNSAQALLGNTSDPAGMELRALIAFRRDRSNTQPLTDCLAKSMVNGVPTVIQQPGLRLLLPENNGGSPIEPSIIDPETQQNLTQRFRNSLLPGSVHTVSGVLTLCPPRSLPTGTSVVSLSVDNTSIGDTNTPPYSFNLDTRTFSNGSHSLTFSMVDSSGTPVGNQDMYVNFLNASQDSVSDSAATDDLTQRIWNLLQIKPAYVVLEYDYAIAALKLHDEEGYETHILRAAALDPDYRDVRERIHPLFIGQVPNIFPIPDGTHLPSSLGLSAGAASTAGFWAGSPNVREMALTFDDGPLPVPNAELLGALRNSNAHGTFFVVGMRAAESPDCLRQMAADGNAVEDHTYTHPNLTQILPQHILQEILRTAVIIQATTGLWPHFLRPPGGNTNTLVLETAKACGMSGAFWTIDALPAEESGSASGVVNWVVSRARPGAIVLMHNGMDATIAAIPDLVRELRQRGYKLVTIRQLAEDALKDKRTGT